MEKEITRKKNERKNEKGAAMVMVLLVSFLLLVASAGLLLETSVNTMNVTDSTAEQQAYNAAESGVQSAINVLRGNVKPNPLFNVDPNHKDNRITYAKAVRFSGSNVDADSDSTARLSRWMTYNYAPNGINDTARVSIGEYPADKYPNGYDPRTGYAYSLSVVDPDRTGEIISYQTEAQFLDMSANPPQWKSSINLGNASNGANITYSPKTRNNMNVSDGDENTDFGSFRVNSVGTFALTSDIRFQILIHMNAPYTTTEALHGWIRKGTITSGATIQFDFDSQEYDVMGSTLKLTNLTNKSLSVVANNTSQLVNGNMTQAEPFRVVIRSVGYGPRGARKELEVTIQKDYFNGLSAPATLTLIGGTSGFNFEAGTSQNVAYSGSNIVNVNEVIPPIGTTNIANLLAVDYNLDHRGQKANITGTPSDVSAELPFWLQSPKNLNKTIQELRRVADASGSTDATDRLFVNGETPGNGNFGDNATATGITFVDGDVSLSGNGGGILICTGKLTLHGGFDFNGLIIVTGAGGVDRRGGGNGLLQGNTVVAPYNPSNLAAGFLAPKYDISGGGNSTIRYNSSSVANGMSAISNIVLGVAEK